MARPLRLTADLLFHHNCRIEYIVSPLEIYTISEAILPTFSGTGTLLVMTREDSLLVYQETTDPLLQALSVGKRTEPFVFPEL
jgi:hypothetical protein